MASVTQRIPNYLGGVSQQTDDLKFPGQLRTCQNAYPEPTFGLMKRPGGKFVAELKDAAGVVISPSTYDNGKWFSIFRDDVERCQQGQRDGQVEMRAFFRQVGGR